MRQVADAFDIKEPEVREMLMRLKVIWNMGRVVWGTLCITVEGCEGYHGGKPVCVEGPASL